MPDGYVCVRVDSRGAGRSPGYLDVWSPREAQDLYDCVEWAGTQPWCNGKVGINGISYYAMNQWQVAALQPPHLAALCVWEGASDYYRELGRHGGILCDFLSQLVSAPGASVQHGVGDRGAAQARSPASRSPDRETLPEDELAKNRADVGGEAHAASAASTTTTARALPEFAKIDGAAAVGRQLGRQGCIRAAISKAICAPAPSRSGSRCTATRTSRISTADYGEALQKRFFGHFLKGEDTGWDKQPHGVAATSAIPARNSCCAAENEWPLARTQWTKYYLRSGGRALGTASAAQRRRRSLRDHRRRPHLLDAAADRSRSRSPARSRRNCGCRRRTRPMPISSWCCACSIRTARRSSSSAPTIRARRSASAGCAPRTASSIRARACRIGRGTRHDEEWPLTPGEPVELDIEIWPTSIVVPPGYRSRSTVRGKDYEV